MPKLTNHELLAIIKAHESTALGGEQGELSNQRGEALKRYYGEPYGDEVEGRSSVISKDLADAIDWILPSLMRIILSTDRPVEFDPVGPEDEEAAQQESDYVNHVLMKQNQGFLILHDLAKDGLLLKNGYVKRWWDETEEVSHETYGPLSEDELLLTLQELESDGSKIDIVERHEEVVETEIGPLTMYTVKVKRTRQRGMVKIEPAPPEEILISNLARGRIEDADFVQHQTRKKRWELVEMGMDAQFVEGLPSWSQAQLSEDDLRRDQVSDESPVQSNLIKDRSMDDIDFRENYIRVDWDGDGIAEMRRVVVVGNQIPPGEEWNREVDGVAFSSWTPNRMPHRHVGLSLHDALDDIARIKTQLLRITLDNTYLLTNLEWIVNERAHLDDFLTSRPGGIKRVLGTEPVDGSVRAVERPPILQHVMPVLEYMDSVKESRSGVNRNLMGLDPDTLKKTTEGAARQALRQVNIRIEMIARMFAETGLKDLVKAIHSLSIKHNTRLEKIRLRNDWVPIRPSEWRERQDMTVNVGIGTGTAEETQGNLLLLAGIQEKAAQAGIVTPRNVLNLSERIASTLGFKQQGLFFSDPDSPEVQAMREQAAQAQQTNPLAEAEQIKGEIRLQIEAIKEERKAQQDEFRNLLELIKQEQHNAREIAKLEIEALLKGFQADLGQPGLGTETQSPLSISLQGGIPDEVSTAIQTLLQDQEESRQRIDMLQSLLQQLGAQTEQLNALVTRPRNIVVQRDENGRIIGARAVPDLQ